MMTHMTRYSELNIGGLLPGRAREYAPPVDADTLGLLLELEAHKPFGYLVPADDPTARIPYYDGYYNGGRKAAAAPAPAQPVAGPIAFLDPPPKDERPGNPSQEQADLAVSMAKFVAADLHLSTAALGIRWITGEDAPLGFVYPDRPGVIGIHDEQHGDPLRRTVAHELRHVHQLATEFEGSLADAEDDAESYAHFVVNNSTVSRNANGHTFIFWSWR
jgi:hypothetical protein